MSLILAVLTVMNGVLSNMFFAERNHYDVSRDLSIYFANADDVIDAVRQCLKRSDRRIMIEFYAESDSMEDIDDIAGEIMEFACAETENSDEGDYLRFRYGGYDIYYSHIPKKDKFYYTIEIAPRYYTTHEQEEKVSAEIERIISSFNFDKNTTDYEKFIRIYNYIYDTVSYDKVHKNNVNNHIKTTAYSALFYHTAVCQGYSSLMYRMLKECGINTRVVTGKAVYDNGEEYHSWNIVCLDGLYYNVDITWDKQSNSKDYFLKSEDDFANHKRDKEFTEQEFTQRYPMSEKSYVF